MSELEYIIRPITNDDVQGFWDAVDFVAREKKYLSFVEGPPIETTVEYVTSNVECGETHFVVESEGKIVGWCDVVQNQSRAIKSHVATLGIGLLPEFRGKGIGTELLHKSIAHAKSRGLERIELGVLEGNDLALELYKKVGFEVEGFCRCVYKIDGKHVGSYEMSMLFIDA